MKELVNYVFDRSNNVYALTVMQNGSVAAAIDPDTRRPVYSATKSILSIGVGLLQAEGRFDVERPLACYLTGGQLALVPDKKREAFKRLPVTRFLTMSVSGFPFRPEGESGWIEQALGADLDCEGEPAFCYSNFPALLVGVAAQNAADEPLEDILCDKLFSPIGVSRPVFKQTPEGYFYGASGMELSCAELSRVGEYLLQNAEGDSYLTRAVSRQIGTREGGYGYFYRVGEGYYYMSGKWGQKCIVCPESKTVITYLSDRKNGDSEIFAMAVRRLKEIS